MRGKSDGCPRGLFISSFHFNWNVYITCPEQQKKTTKTTAPRPIEEEGERGKGNIASGKRRGGQMEGEKGAWEAPSSLFLFCFPSRMYIFFRCNKPEHQISALQRLKHQKKKQNSEGEDAASCLESFLLLFVGLLTNIWSFLWLFDVYHLCGGGPSFAFVHPPLSSQKPDALSSSHRLFTWLFLFSHFARRCAPPWSLHGCDAQTCTIGIGQSHWRGGKASHTR